MINVYGTEKKEYIDLFEKVFKSAIDFIGQKEDVEVELEFVSEEEIKEINNQTRGVDRVTDVLSFPTLDAGKKEVLAKDYPCDVNPESGLVVLGEIIVCEKRAIEQSQEFGHSAERELGFLCAHGLLHLFGYDHMNETDKKEMREIEKQIRFILRGVKE